MDQQEVALSHDQTHQYEQDPSNVGLHAEGEDHEKKSVLKKVKAKARKIKDTLKLHGYGHNHDQHQEGRVPDDHDLDEEDDEEEEEVVEPEIHGSSGSGAAAMKTEVPGQELEGPGTFIERSRAMDEDSLRNPQPKVTDYPTESGFVSGREEGKDQLKLDVGRTGQIKEVPDAPANTPATVGIIEHKDKHDPIRSLVREQEANRGQPGIQLEGLEEDPQSPKGRRVDSSNYQTKVTDPTGAGGEEVGINSILQSFDKMNVHETKPEEGVVQNISPEPRGFSSVVPTGSHDQFSPELAPPKQISADQEVHEPIQQGAHTSEVQEHPSEEVRQRQTNQGSYSEKISSATSAIAGKAISAKNVVASKLGYGQGRPETQEGQGQHVTHEEQEPAKGASTMGYGKKIAATVTEKFTPVYQKVTEKGSNVISKVPGISHGTGSVSERSVEGQDKGVSVKDYFAEKLRPGDEDRALSEVISETLHKRKEEGEKAEKPMGKVTESEEVKRRLGGLDESPILKVDESDERVPGKGVVDKLKGAVGSWFGKGETTNAPSEQSLGSSNGTEGFQSSIVGEEIGERRLQESGN